MIAERRSGLATLSSFTGAMDYNHRASVSTVNLPIATSRSGRGPLVSRLWKVAPALRASHRRSQSSNRRRTHPVPPPLSWNTPRAGNPRPVRAGRRLAADDLTEDSPLTVRSQDTDAGWVLGVMPCAETVVRMWL